MASVFVRTFFNGLILIVVVTSKYFNEEDLIIILGTFYFIKSIFRMSDVF